MAQKNRENQGITVLSQFQVALLITQWSQSSKSDIFQNDIIRVLFSALSWKLIYQFSKLEEGFDSEKISPTYIADSTTQMSAFQKNRFWIQALSFWLAVVLLYIKRQKRKIFYLDIVRTKANQIKYHTLGCQALRRAHPPPPTVVHHPFGGRSKTT